MRGVVVAIVLTGGCSAFQSESFKCSDPVQCTAAPGGTCTASFDGQMYCAYPSSFCPDGLAFGESSGPTSNACVPAPAVIPTDDAGLSSVTIDAFRPLADAPPTTVCVGNESVLQICVGATQIVRTFKDQTLYSHGDNNHDSSCDFTQKVGDTQLCIIQGSSITFDGTVTLEDATGTRPLVFVSTGSIAVNGILDGSTRRNKSLAGPGAITASNLGSCDHDGADGGDANVAGAGGGGGGAFGTAGGSGGTGNAGATSGGVAAIAHAMSNLIQSGCRGEYGGNATKKFEPFGTHNGGDGGYSGGVVYFISAADIAISGTIDVSGMGGGGGGTSAGGGGGGPGGFVGLDGKTIEVTGSVIANGGGGGGGGGFSGDNGGSSLAKGGAGFNGGGTGGNGTSSDSMTGQSGAGGLGSAGGGGGGGGQGVVWLVAPEDAITGADRIVAVKVPKP